jgi:L-lactate dehydrogenase
MNDNREPNRGGEQTAITAETLVKCVRDPCSGEVHLRGEEVTVSRVILNLDRTLLRASWLVCFRRSRKKSVRGSGALRTYFGGAVMLRGLGGIVKIGIIGAGAVGTACAFAVVMRGCASELVLLDLDCKRARGVVSDLQYGAPLSPAVTLIEGDYHDLAGADLIMITAGVNERAGAATDRRDPSGRLRLLDANAAVYGDVVPRFVEAAPEAMILVVTDPPDPLADLARQLIGHDRVLSTGTFLDSLRFQFHLAKRLELSPASVQAMVIGEHGTSEVFLWSGARVGGMTADQAFASQSGDVAETRQAVEEEVRYANITIIEGIGASQLGIGMVSARIAEIVLRDERAAIPIGVFNRKFGTTLSMPGILGRNGVSRILEPAMTEQELQGLQRSADTLKAASRRIGALANT